MSIEEQTVEQVKTILGEHFDNFALVVQYEDGSVWGETNNAVIARGLHLEALDQLKDARDATYESLECEWVDDDDDTPEFC